MSFNQPPPNPHGQQPPPPGPPPGYGPPQQAGVPEQQNPYAQPGQPPAHNPYTQPPGAHPYGQPQGVPGGNPYSQPPGAPNPYTQPGWGGQMPPSPPPWKGNAGKIIALVAVLAVVGVGIAIAVTSSGSTSGSSSSTRSASGNGGGGGGNGNGDGKDTARYKLTTPQTIAGGYRLQGTGQTAAPSNGKQIPGVSNPMAVAGNYQDSNQKVLTFGGDYGTISDPGSVVDTTFAVVKTNTSTAGKVAFVGTAEEEHPSGFDGTQMKCQEISINSALPGAMCVWADPSTVGEVILLDPKAALTGGATAPDLSAAADITAKVRQDVRVRAS